MEISFLLHNFIFAQICAFARCVLLLLLLVVRILLLPPTGLSRYIYYCVIEWMIVVDLLELIRNLTRIPSHIGEIQPSKSNYTFECYPAWSSDRIIFRTNQFRVSISKLGNHLRIINAPSYNNAKLVFEDKDWEIIVAYCSHLRNYGKQYDDDGTAVHDQ